MKKILFVVLGTVVLAGAGCNNYVAEKAVEAGTGNKVKIGNDDKTLTVKTGEGEMQLGEVKKMPDNWPEDAPVYPGSTIQLVSSSNPAEGNASVSVMLLTSDALQAVVDFYKRELVAKGWLIETDYEATDIAIFGASKDNRTMSLTSGSSDEGSSITMTIETEKE